MLLSILHLNLKEITKLNLIFSDMQTNLMQDDDIIFRKPKRKIKIMFQNDYDRYWKAKIMESPKAISYCKFKYNASLEKYMYTIKNVRHKIALTRLGLSNHNLRIETGRHLRPKLPRQERECFICIDEIENELHFVVKCPLYSSERK